MQNATKTTRHRLRRKLHAELGETLLAALEEPDVVELMVNEDGAVWCDRLGKGMETLPMSFSAERAMTLVGTVAALLGTVATADIPIVEGELPFDGARFEAIVPPVSRQALLSIRKHASQVFSLAQYITQERISEDQVSFLREAVAKQRNIIVAGATASGKTTFSNALLHEKVECGDPAQRIVILEDTSELQCAARNVVHLRTSESADLQRLVRATLRLRPDAIIVGEVRGREALDLLKAWNTGHPGGVATLHANSARAALSRLDQLVQEAGVPSQPGLIAEAVDIIVFLAGRHVTDIAWVRGLGQGPGEFDIQSMAKGNS